MSTVLNGSPIRGLIEESKRLKPWREAGTDLASLLAGARDEQDRGEYENAYTAYRMTLAEGLRQRWIQHSGKAGTPIVDPKTLQDKLRAAGKLDAWFDHLLKSTHHRPCPVEASHVRVLGAITETLVEGL